MRSPRAPDRDWSRLGFVRRLRLPVPTPTLFNKVKGDKETIIGLSSESDSATCHKLRSLKSFICFSNQCLISQNLIKALNLITDPFYPLASVKYLTFYGILIS